MANYFTEIEDLKFHLHHPLMKKIVNLREKGFVDERSYDFAPHDYEDTLDTYEKVMDIVGEICDTIIAPNAKSVDTEGPLLENNEVKYARGTRENYDALVQAGLIGMTLPRKYGGLNFPITAYIIAGEMISRADAGFANIWGLQDCAETIHEFASEDLKDKYLPLFNKGATAAMDLTEPDAGSDLQAVQLKATYDSDKDTWFLNGVKRFITNGDADISLVLARSEEDSLDARGLSLFLYDRKERAVTIRRIEKKLGIKGSPTCELVFNNAPAYLIGSRKMGLIKYVMTLMNSARLGVGGQAIGISEAAYQEAMTYAKKRAQFGKPIIQFPAVYEMLTNMKVNITALRSLMYETARMIDIYKSYIEISTERTLTREERTEMKENNRSADVFTPLLKLMAAENSNRIAYDALQVHGGAGFMKDFPIERIFRDARITSIYEGTSQLQVLAAIKGVTTGAYLKKIHEYQEIEVRPELEYLRRKLAKMNQGYEKITNYVKKADDDEFLDFHARRLVEIAGNIIMGHLLVLDAMRDNKYKYIAELFIKAATAENKQKTDYIRRSALRDLDTFKQITAEQVG
ncbi:MAG: acyl-CoA dehydrogenase family protein [Cyclobacteriaceae bacterium]|nr:acyl-CoA dehydrogenase family protein [Cyclobacteriaceae bacterium]